MIEIQGPDTVERKPVKMGEAELEETPAEQSGSEVEEIPAEQGDPEGEAAPSGHAAAELEDGSCPELFQDDCRDLVSEPETAERLDGEDPSDSGRGFVPDADRATDTDLVTDPDRVPDADSVANSGHGSVSDPDPTDEELEGDEMLPAAVDVILETGQASVSMLQRRLKLGYSRAARLVDQMEERGYVGPFEGSKPRAILITKEQWSAKKGGQTEQMGFDDLDSAPDELM